MQSNIIPEQIEKKWYVVLGWKFIAILFATQFLGKGVYYGILTYVLLPLFRSYGIDSSTYQVLAATATLSWAFNPIIGLLSDKFVIFYYHKKYWMFICTIIGLVGSGIAFEMSPVAVIIGFFLIHLEISTNDLMAESKYTEIIRDNPKTGTVIQSFVNALDQLGVMVGVIIVGNLTQAGEFTPIFIIILLLSIPPLVFIIFEWFPEKRQPYCFQRVEMANINVSKLQIILPITTSVGAIFIGLSMMFFGNLVSIIMITLLLILLIIGGLFAFPKIVSYTIIYRTLTYIAYLNINGAMDYFYTSDIICNPSGPNFSYNYYIMYTGIIASLFSFVGTIIYEIALSKCKFRTSLMVTSIAYSLAGLMDIIIVTRFNLVVGIPDKIFYMIGSTMIFSLIDMLAYIPLLTLISKTCPKGSEATIYGYIAGISIIASAFSSVFGTYMTDWFGIITSGENCDFSNLWILILATHIILTVVILLPATFLLIPNIYPTDDIPIEKHSEKNEMTPMIPKV